VVCLDEKPVPRHADVRPASPAAPGREARYDNEYQRCGTANVFCAVEPKAGRHFTFPTPNRSGAEFAQVACRLADQYPEATTIHLSRGQPQYSRPQVADGLLGGGERQPDLGSVHGALHPCSWKLAQSGRDRNWPVFPAVPRSQKNSEPSDAPAGEPCLEPPDQSCPYPDQLEVRPPSRPPEVRVYQELF